MSGVTCAANTPTKHSTTQNQETLSLLLSFKSCILSIHFPHLSNVPPPGLPLRCSITLLPSPLTPRSVPRLFPSVSSLTFPALFYTLHPSCLYTFPLLSSISPSLPFPLFLLYVFLLLSTSSQQHPLLSTPLMSFALPPSLHTTTLPLVHIVALAAPTTPAQVFHTSITPSVLVTLLTSLQVFQNLPSSHTHTHKHITFLPSFIISSSLQQTTHSPAPHPLLTFPTFS